MSDVPEIGFQMQQRFNRYELIGIEEAFRKTDGEPTIILRWRSWCHDCGDPFEATGPRSLDSSLSRRCARHAQRGVKTRKKR